MHRAQAPAPAIAGTDIVVVEPDRDGLEAHRSVIIDTVQRHPVDAPHGLGLDRVAFQLLLDLRAAMPGLDDPIADVRTRAVPAALTRALLLRPQRVLAVLLRLLFFSQPLDLAPNP